MAGMLADLQEENESTEEVVSDTGVSMLKAEKDAILESLKGCHERDGDKGIKALKVLAMEPDKLEAAMQEDPEWTREVWLASAKCSQLNADCSKLLSFILSKTELNPDKDLCRVMRLLRDAPNSIRALLETGKISEEAWTEIRYEYCHPLWDDVPSIDKIPDEWWEETKCALHWLCEGAHSYEKIDIILTLMASDKIPKEAWFYYVEHHERFHRYSRRCRQCTAFDCLSRVILSEEIGQKINDVVKTELAQGLWKVYNGKWCCQKDNKQRDQRIPDTIYECSVQQGVPCPVMELLSHLFRERLYISTLPPAEHDVTLLRQAPLASRNAEVLEEVLRTGLPSANIPLLLVATRSCIGSACIRDSQGRPKQEFVVSRSLRWEKRLVPLAFEQMLEPFVELTDLLDEKLVLEWKEKTKNSDKLLDWIDDDFSVNNFGKFKLGYINARFYDLRMIWGMAVTRVPGAPATYLARLLISNAWSDHARYLWLDIILIYIHLALVVTIGFQMHDKVVPNRVLVGFLLALVIKDVLDTLSQDFDLALSRIDWVWRLKVKLARSRSMGWVIANFLCCLCLPITWLIIWPVVVIIWKMKMACVEVVMCLLLLKDDDDVPVHLQALLAISAAWSWLRCLWCLRGFRRIGLRILPIVFALKDIGGFIVVLLFALLAAANAYYVFGARDEPSTLYAAILQVFRLGVLGDVDLFELEGLDTVLVMDDNDNVLAPQDPSPSKHYVYIHILFYMVTASITIVLMNLFIGVLSSNYDRYEAKATELFMKARAEIIVDSFHTPLWRIFHRCFGQELHRYRSTFVDRSVKGFRLFLFTDEDLEDCGDITAEERSLRLVMKSEVSKVKERMAQDKREIKDQVAEINARITNIDEKMASKLEEQGRVLRKLEEYLSKIDIPPATFTL